MRFIYLFSSLLLMAFFQSQNSFALGRSNVGVNFGIASGGVTLGGEYEYLMKRHYGVAGYARFFQKDTGNSSRVIGNGYGIFALGASVRLHHRVEEFDFSVAPGVGLFNVDAGNKDTTSLGPSFSMALTYKLTDSASIGLENTGYWIWLDEDFRGQIVDDTSLRMTFNF